MKAIAAGATLLALMALPTAAPAAPAAVSGLWRAELAHPGGPLPFGLEVSADGRRAWILNPPERLPVEQVRFDGTTLVLAFPSYGSELRLAAEGGRLVGTATLIRRDGPVRLSVVAGRGTHRFAPRPGAVQPIVGRWTVTTGGPRPQTGSAQFRASGGLVTGAVQFPTGDTRYLAGDFANGTLRLSTFDGNATSLWIGRLEAGRLAGEQWSATSARPTPWQAVRAAQAPSPTVAVQTVTPRPIRFAFPDASGRTVSLADPRYRGKVVLVAIGGAWCPNCHDEARFLGPYATRRQREGLEVIGLQFEYGSDTSRAFRQLGSFAARYRLPYPLLLAGEPTPESTRAALPDIGGVQVYPTTLLIDRRGRLREIHAGWAGPATGALHRKTVAELDAAVTRLLREPGPDQKRGKLGTGSNISASKP
jgi:peroxiredoxin